MTSLLTNLIKLFVTVNPFEIFLFYVKLTINILSGPSYNTFITIISIISYCIVIKYILFLQLYYSSYIVYKLNINIFGII